MASAVCQRMYYEPEAGTIYPDDLAVVIEVSEERDTNRVGLKLISSRGVVGWNAARYFESVE